MKTVQLIKELDGQEVWTNAFGDRFGERVCVMVEEGLCHKEGKKFKPTQKEIKDLWDDYIAQEFGSKDQMMRELEREFGHLKTKADIEKEFGK